jgi:hypothetical protein
MEFARSKVDGKPYYAIQLSPEQRLALKDQLVCDGCDQPAFYRSQSISGKPALFFAKHSDDCRYKIECSDSSSPESSNTRNIKANDGKTIILDFSSSESQFSGAQPNKNLTRVNGHGQGRFADNAEYPESSVSHKSLRRLHKLLTVSDDFLLTNPKLVIPGVGEAFASNFFVYSIKNHAHNGYVGFLFTISKATISKKTGYLWLNTDGVGSVLIGVDKVDELYSVYGIKSSNELIGMNALTIGQPRAINAGDVFMPLSHVKYISLLDS